MFAVGDVVVRKEGRRADDFWVAKVPSHLRDQEFKVKKSDGTGLFLEGFSSRFETVAFRHAKPFTEADLDKFM